jgi:hypothetical protein
MMDSGAVAENTPGSDEESRRIDNHDRGWFSARPKAEAVLRLLRGEDLDALSRELGVVADVVDSTWTLNADPDVPALLPPPRRSGPRVGPSWPRRPVAVMILTPVGFRGDIEFRPGP